MIHTFRRFCQAFGAGALGGFIACIIFTLLYRAGVPDALDVTYRPGIFRTFNVSSPGLALVGREGIFIIWLYEAICIYGLFGFLFLLPYLRHSQMQRALAFSAIPVAFELLFFLPQNGYKLFGLGLGGFTFVFVFMFCAIWGLIAVTFEPKG